MVEAVYELLNRPPLLLIPSAGQPSAGNAAGPPRARPAAPPPPPAPLGPIGAGRRMRGAAPRGVLRGGGRSRPGPGPRRAPPWWAARRSCGSASCPAAASWWRCAGPGGGSVGRSLPREVPGGGARPPAAGWAGTGSSRRRAASCEQRRGPGPGGWPGTREAAAGCSRKAAARLWAPVLPGAVLALHQGARPLSAAGLWLLGAGAACARCWCLSCQAQGCETQPGIGALLRSPGADRRGQL